MSNQYRLMGVGNAELVAGLSKLVQQSNALTAQVLAHLVELDERQLHLKLGFSSLFAYCVEGLGMSEGTAGRRVTAARVCRRFPDAFERVARGELHLCALCALAPHLNEQNAAEWFDACRGKTRRQIEERLAVRFPRPDVREQIRRLAARVSGWPAVRWPKERMVPLRKRCHPLGLSNCIASPETALVRSNFGGKAVKRAGQSPGRKRAPEVANSNRSRPVALACTSRRTPSCAT